MEGVTRFRIASFSAPLFIDYICQAVVLWSSLRVVLALSKRSNRPTNMHPSPDGPLEDVPSHAKHSLLNEKLVARSVNGEQCNAKSELMGSL